MSIYIHGHPRFGCDLCCSSFLLCIDWTLFCVVFVLWVAISGVLDTTLCDKVCQWLAAGMWFTPGTKVSSTNKTDRHDIT